MRVFITLLLPLLLQGFSLQQATKDTYIAKKSPPPKATNKPLYATSAPWRKNRDFAKKFAIVEYGGLSDLQETKSLPPTTIAYEWAAGFYTDENSSFLQWVRTHPNTLLNRTPLHHNDFYYDMCNEELLQKRIAYLIQKAKELHIKGYFFDWANDLFLEEKDFANIKQEFRHRHQIPYHQCLKKLFQALRNAGLLIVTNQAYRNPELLNATNYDMCESYLSGVEDSHAMATIDGTTTFIPTTILQPLDEVLSYFDLFHSYKKRYGFKEMIYMNYAAPDFAIQKGKILAKKPKDIIYYNYVLAKLGGFYSYTEVPFNHALEEEDIYFYNLGLALSSMQKFDSYYFRFFQKGFVILAPALHKDTYIKLPINKKLYDLKKQLLLYPKDGWITIKLESNYKAFENRYIPTAKVYLYED